MGEARQNGAARLIDTSVSDRVMQDARKQYVKYLSERLMVAMVTGAPPAGFADSDSLPQLHDKAWKLAELHYTEMIRREALSDPVSLTERLAADSMVAAARMVA